MDILNFTLSEISEIIHFEMMTSDFGYFTQKIAAPLGNEIAGSPEYFHDYFGKKINQHSRKDYRAPHDIFESWPDQFKGIFFFKMAEYGAERLIRLYEGLGYRDSFSMLSRNKISA